MNHKNIIPQPAPKQVQIPDFKSIETEDSHPRHKTATPKSNSVEYFLPFVDEHFPFGFSSCEQSLQVQTCMIISVPQYYSTATNKKKF